MSRVLLLSALFIVAVPVMASAQQSRGTPEQQRACRGDATKFCRGLKEDAEIYQCLKQHAAQLTKACRTVIGAR
jgi:hypothetical protein